MKDNEYSAEEIIKEWLDYKEIIAHSKKNFDEAIKKTQEIENEQ